MRPLSRGMALIQALLIVAAIAAVATALLLRADRARERLEWRQTGDQAALYLDSAVSLLRASLPQGVVHPGQDWAQPRSGQVIDQGTLAWRIEDLQGRFNLALLGGETAAPMRAAFARLAAGRGLSDAAVARVLSQVDGAGTDLPLVAPWLWRSLAGDEVAEWDRLMPFLAVLPPQVALNINTLSPELLEALAPGLPRLARDTLLRQLARAPFASTEALQSWATQRLGAEAAAQLQALPLGVGSTHFAAHLEARLDSLVLRRSVVIDTGGPTGPGAVLMSMPWSE